jgi:Type I phosphodiesterase / nucleotide pyrophosphatase
MSCCPAPVVLLEFNELTPALMERFVAEGHLPNFLRLRERSEVFVSDAQEQEPYLEPWIQWVTVHTGVPYSEHGVFRLSEGHKLRHRNVWDWVSAKGQPVWICGSMNAQREKGNGNEKGTRDYFLPDPWSTDLPPYPDALLPYYRFVQRNVQEYTNDRIPLSKSDYIKFIAFMITHGLSASSAISIVRQLFSEKKTRGGRWRRAFILEKLQFDVFSAIYRRNKPAFSTFFLNSTAHMQHRYWRYMEPGLFTAPSAQKKQLEYESSILEGYRAMDDLLGRMLDLVGDEATVVLSTGLSQQPCLTYEEAGGKCGYRPKDFAQFLSFAGITSNCRVEPVMSEQFWLRLDNVDDAMDVEAKLAVLKVGEERALYAKRDGCGVFVSCCIHHALPENAVLRVEDSERSMAFFEVFYALEGGKSGMHHPDGILWIRHPGRSHQVHQERVPLASVAPTLLDMLGIEKPEYMMGESVLRNPDARSIANEAADMEEPAGRPA